MLLTGLPWSSGSWTLLGDLIYSLFKCWSTPQGWSSHATCVELRTRLICAALGGRSWSANCSITRWRALMHSLSVQLFGEALILPEFPRRPDINGMGLRDATEYADTLSERLDFTVTYYHREPILDITDPPRIWLRTARLRAGLRCVRARRAARVGRFEGATGFSSPVASCS